MKTIEHFFKENERTRSQAICFSRRNDSVCQKSGYVLGRLRRTWLLLAFQVTHGALPDHFPDIKNPFDVQCAQPKGLFLF